MRQSALGLVIAERTFQTGSDGTQVILRIGTPRPHPRGDWRCPFQIIGLGKETVKETGGVDAVQALMLCIEMAGHELEALGRNHGLRWLGETDLGLSWRDLPAAAPPPPPPPPPPQAQAPAPTVSEAVPRPVAAEPVTKAVDNTAKRKKKTQIAVVKSVTPDAALRAVVGDGPMSRKDVTRKLWGYIKRHGLQDRLHRRTINADEKLRAVFGGQSQVQMAEIEKLIDKHVK